MLRWPHTCLTTRNGDRIINRFRHHEVKDSTSDERGEQMSRKIVMDEELAIHEEEGEIMGQPSNGEKTGVIPKAIADGCKD